MYNFTYFQSPHSRGIKIISASGIADLAVHKPTDENFPSTFLREQIPLISFSMVFAGTISYTESQKCPFTQCH